ncbi:MAG: tetratricopeptide repeat protein [Planctomycetota bacterium]|nr:tetratricopeptide repeat protein [Planctomycetota bacterium]
MARSGRRKDSLEGWGGADAGGRQSGEAPRLPAIDQDDPAAVCRAASFYYSQGHLKEAEVLYRRARDLAPHRAAYHNNLANVLCDLGRLREGIAEYEEAIRLSPSPPPEAEANLRLARMELRLIVERVEFLERAVILEVCGARERVALGCARLLQGRPEDALAEFRKAAEMDPDCLPARLNAAFVHTLHPEALTPVGEAIREAAEASVRFPNEPRLLLHQGELYEAAGHFDAAMTRYLQAIERAPRCSEAYILAGRLAETCGPSAVRNALDNLDRSAKRRMAMVKHGPEWAAAQLDRAFARLMRHRALGEPFRLAGPLLKAVHTAVAGGGESVWAYRLWGALLEAAGKRQEAVAKLTEALARFPRDPWLAHDIGALNLRGGDPEGAVAWFEKASLWAPDDAVPFHSLRYAFELLRHYVTEDVRFQRAIARDPNDAQAHFQMGVASLNALKYGEAAGYFIKTLALDPGMAEARCGLARALARMGRHAEARAEYKKALNMDPGCIEALRGLTALDLEAGDASDEVLARLDKIRSMTP